MADVRRLGKRGSYRLGRLGVPPPGPGRAPRAHYPSFLPARRGPASAWVLGGLAGVAVVAAGAALGWWFVPFLAGVAAGVAGRFGRLRLRTALPAILVIAAAGWAVPLAWAMVRGLPVQAVARTVAALAGLPAHASVVLALTLLVAMLQAAAGLWVGRVLTPRPDR